jgi:hypothetical protein
MDVTPAAGSLGCPKNLRVVGGRANGVPRRDYGIRYRNHLILWKNHVTRAIDLYSLL